MGNVQVLHSNGLIEKNREPEHLPLTNPNPNPFHSFRYFGISRTFLGTFRRHSLNYLCRLCLVVLYFLLFFACFHCRRYFSHLSSLVGLFESSPSLTLSLSFSLSLWSLSRVFGLWLDIFCHLGHVLFSILLTNPVVMPALNSPRVFTPWNVNNRKTK